VVFAEVVKHWELLALLTTVTCVLVQKKLAINFGDCGIK